MMGITTKARLLTAAIVLVPMVLLCVGLLIVEQSDVRHTREAQWRICERGNHERAEHHSVAVDFKPLKEERQSRVEENLPILNCDPNLDGGAAVPRPKDEQRRYRDRYKRGQLDPTPEPAR